MTTATEVQTIDWAGQSGKTYRYWIYPVGSALAAKGGNYCFAKEVSPGRWTPIYFGESSNLSERTNLDTHHRGACIRRNGATHVHAHLNDNAQARLDEEADLRAKWDPPCNRQ